MSLPITTGEDWGWWGQSALRIHSKAVVEKQGKSFSLYSFYSSYSQNDNPWCLPNLTTFFEMVRTGHCPLVPRVPRKQVPDSCLWRMRLGLGVIVYDVSLSHTHTHTLTHHITTAY